MESVLCAVFCPEPTLGLSAAGLKAMGGEGKPRNGAKPSGLVSQKSWAETAGSGDRHGVWGVTGVAGEALAITGTLLLVTCCPIVSLLTCATASAHSGHPAETRA